MNETRPIEVLIAELRGTPIHDLGKDKDRFMATVRELESATATLRRERDEAIALAERYMLASVGLRRERDELVARVPTERAPTASGAPSRCLFPYNDDGTGPECERPRGHDGSHRVPGIVWGVRHRPAGAKRVASLPYPELCGDPSCIHNGGREPHP